MRIPNATVYYNIQPKIKRGEYSMPTKNRIKTGTSSIIFAAAITSGGLFYFPAAGVD